MNVIEIRGLTKIYRRSNFGVISETIGIKDLDLKIEKGEIFSLIGPNGSGKTTTIKLLLGLLRPSGGEISILGEKLPSLNILKKIGYLPELINFHNFLTVREALTFFYSLSGLQGNKKRIDDVIELLKLGGEENKRISELSKGFLQRLGIAQAILHDPEVLIFDEPVSGLDPLEIMELRNFLLFLKDKGKTIFFSSHVISEVERISDRVGVLDGGKLKRIIRREEWSKQDGKLEEIFIETVKAAK